MLGESGQPTVIIDADLRRPMLATIFDRPGSVGLSQLLAGQVHSHPTDAYHSEVDDHNPLVTLLGSLSLVVPHFARAGRADVLDWAWYRLVGLGRWAELSRADRVELVDEA